jgi:hypothetical protein
MNSYEQQQPHSLPSGNKHNQKLRDGVHPQNWPTKPAAAAGLVSSSVVATLGAKSAFIERHMMEGDCLVTECVPSKILIK